VKERRKRRNKRANGTLGKKSPSPGSLEGFPIQRYTRKDILAVALRLPMASPIMQVRMRVRMWEPGLCARTCWAGGGMSALSHLPLPRLFQGTAPVSLPIAGIAFHRVLDLFVLLFFNACPGVLRCGSGLGIPLH